VTRIGFLVPPGNPTVEPEMTRLAPEGVTVHFTRMVAHGEAGSHRGQEERNRSQIAHLDENVALLAMVKPAVIAMARAASRRSRHSGRDPGPRLRVAPFRRARQTLTACAARSSSSQRFAGSRRNTVSSGTSSLSHRPRFSSSASSPGRQSTSPA